MEDRMSGFCIKAGNGGGNGGAATGTKCGRWNPTAEQVKVLTDLFKSGLRTPSTDQIQKISTQLSFYGKIESKNVFYWFQNHKARERQKRRKVSVDQHHHHHHRPDPDQRDVVRRIDHKINSSPKHFVEVSQVADHLQSERVIETLQLFPLNSFEEDEDEPENHKLMRMHANDYHQDQTTTTTTTFSYTIGSDDQMNHPPLDLRLSFL